MAGASSLADHEKSGGGPGGGVVYRSRFIRFFEVASLEDTRKVPGASLELKARDSRRFLIAQEARAQSGS
ncbi:MAG: hypothetical protein EA385_04060 [Salinarimonadaceae bacterium]|nr:MAG: hypothetical protein EA385_04060 [Salinarimonadaceae bacterium]